MEIKTHEFNSVRSKCHERFFLKQYKLEREGMREYGFVFHYLSSMEICKIDFA